MRVFILFFVGISFLTSRAKATAQIGDVLIIDGDTSFIFSNPLEPYFKTKGERSINGQELYGLCTALWRGYIATWEIKNDSLFLVNVVTNGCSDNPISLDIESEFGSKKVFANWVTTTLLSPKGRLIKYVHMGYASHYEKEDYYAVNQGIIVDYKSKLNVKYNPRRTFPGEYYLSHAIEVRISESLEKNILMDMPDKEVYSITIHFKKNGTIKDIFPTYESDSSNKYVQYLVSRSKEVLSKFPRLMRVKNKDYTPTYVPLSLNSHCLKFPDDLGYGCGK